ncbi:site-specific integrase [Oscillibacter sp. MSJ-2]|uniref:Site-specific integrase n=1 Tax=Dysosmobacter acutus TaxID=2841504 RepID=A0ABS6FBU9_9FIRM|nr:site-specific integrase [Dysosmobacter acutus]MBU5627752.1 site-specific integrase [Dysosmobacter acutus]
MKIPEPKKLSSGKYRIQVMVDGKRTGKTFATPEECIYWASGIKTKSIENDKSPRRITVSEAADRYIESKDAVLSPSTIAGYKKIKKNLMGPISSTSLPDLTQEKIQHWVNGLVKSGKSAKTIANAHGFLSAILSEYKPSMALKTTLPQKVKADIHIPSEGEIKAIVEASRGTRYELPIILALWLGLRQSEILGLEWSDIDGDYLHIRRAIVMGENGPVEKGTKTYSGTRRIHLPDPIKTLINAQPNKGTHIVPLTGKAIYSGFSRICEKAGTPHFRFHDLRHMNASIMLAEGIPDKYGMKRMGHATNNMLKTVYQHTIREREIEYDAKIDSKFEELFKPD